MLRNFSTCVMLVILAFGASGGQITALVRAAYPSDIAKREALARCAAGDGSFFRFSSEDRLACYKRQQIPASADASRVASLHR